jgi:hypothetical protein
MKIKVSQRGGERQNLDFYKGFLESLLKHVIPQCYHDKLSVKLVMAINDKSTHLDGNLGQALKKSKYNYIVSVDRTATVDDILVTLAHEAVHVAQFVTGKLNSKKINGKIHWFWKDKNYGHGVYEISKSPDGQFLELPWEAEAVKKELPLVKKILVNTFT